LNDGSCVRLRPTHKDHVWSYDFVAERTSDGRAIRMLNIIDEYTRECLAIRVARKITASDVIDTLADVFIRRGTPQFIRSDNGPEFVAQLTALIYKSCTLMAISIAADPDILPVPVYRQARLVPAVAVAAADAPVESFRTSFFVRR